MQAVFFSLFLCVNFALFNSLDVITPSSKAAWNPPPEFGFMVFLQTNPNNVGREGSSFTWEIPLQIHLLSAHVFQMKPHMQAGLRRRWLQRMMSCCCFAWKKHEGRIHSSPKTCKGPTHSKGK